MGKIVGGSASTTASASQAVYYGQCVGTLTVPTSGIRTDNAAALTVTGKRFLVRWDFVPGTTGTCYSDLNTSITFASGSTYMEAPANGAPYLVTNSQVFDATTLAANPLFNSVSGARSDALARNTFQLTAATTSAVTFTPAIGANGTSFFVSYRFFSVTVME